MVLEVGESLKVMVGSGGGEVVGQEYLPILLALGKMELVVGQMRVVVDRAVFSFQLGGCRGYWLMIQPIQLNH